MNVTKLDPSDFEWSIDFTALGEPASKANSRRLVTSGKGQPRFIRSDKALAYERDFKLQCPRMKPLLTGPLFVWLDIWYQTMRPDLDESIILDSMQGFVYENDRQVQQRVARRFLDKRSPRAHVYVAPLS